MHRRLNASPRSPTGNRPSIDTVEVLLLAIGLVAMYGFTLVDLARTTWSTPEQGHGPIVLGVSAWLAARKWAQLKALPPAAASWTGAVLVTLGSVTYFVGRALDVQFLEVGSLPIVLAGTLLFWRGPRGLVVAWFPIFFLLFMVPLPGAVVDVLTMPMKLAVSWVVETVLYAAGYPIARNGVILQVGQYQLLVADVCAGLQTLFTLEAMGLLYLNLISHPSALRTTLLAILIVPIAFAANVIRVIILVLITYYLGDEVGQGFIHGFAGIVLFASALALTIFVDHILRALVPSRSHPRPVTGV
jgi:exosortase B